MSTKPRYNYPAGTRLNLQTGEYELSGRTELGYKAEHSQSGMRKIIRYEDLVAYLRQGGVKVDTCPGPAGSRLQIRLGGFTSWAALSADQQDRAKFHFCIVQAIQALQQKIQQERGDPDFRLSGMKLSEMENRKFVRDHASLLYGKDIHLKPVRGGDVNCKILYQGRTLMRYYERYLALKPGEEPLDELVTLDHKKGNRERRLFPATLRLMKQAFEDVGLDLKGLQNGSVRKQFQVLARDAGLGALGTPSVQSFKNLLTELLRPTELLGATMGESFARNKRGRGSTDIRALCVGELVEIDECKLSLVSIMKEKEVWNTLPVEHQSALEDIDKEIRARLTLLVMIDVASRMILAWVLSDQPRAEATLALLRMATRDKTREKVRYGCSGFPAPPVGLGSIRMDNGWGLRNPQTIGALVGLQATAIVVRARAATDKNHVERVFGTLQYDVMQMIHGYTGRKPGELPGYDARANGVLYAEELYGIVSRYFTDEYASTGHLGTGMGGRAPYDVMEILNETRGMFKPVDEVIRLIQLGWRETVTPTDEGVCVCHGLWYSSPKFQEQRDGHDGKVSVFYDPDQLKWAVVLVPGIKEPFRVKLQITAFADLTLPEVLNLMGEWRKSHARVESIHQDRILDFRKDLFKLMRAIGVERGLARSYSTFEECQAKGRVVFAGARVTLDEPLSETAAPGHITQADPRGHVFTIGADDSPTATGLRSDRHQGHASLAETSVSEDPHGEAVSEASTDGEPKRPKRTRTPRGSKSPTQQTSDSWVPGRPKDLGALE